MAGMRHQAQPDRGEMLGADHGPLQCEEAPKDVGAPLATPQAGCKDSSQAGDPLGPGVGEPIRDHVDDGLPGAPLVKRAIQCAPDRGRS